MGAQLAASLGALAAAPNPQELLGSGEDTTADNTFVPSTEKPILTGRFAGSGRPTLKMLLWAFWDGFRLKCPSCSEGALYQGFTQMHRECPKCGAPFERYGEGDFLGAMVTCYSLASVFVAKVILLINVLTDMPIWDQIIVAIVIGFAFVILLYRNLKGIWVAILLALLRWMK